VSVKRAAKCGAKNIMKNDYPRQSLALYDFRDRFLAAFDTGDFDLWSHLSTCFKIGNDPLAIYIGCICGHGRDASSNDKRTRT